MEEVYETLARRAEAKYDESGGRVIIAIAGVPGSGKSTVADRVAEILNSRIEKSSSSEHPVAVVVPMDGFHYSRNQLDEFPDPTEAHRRRGAPWTFDASGVVDLVKRLKLHSSEVIRAPTFDHSIKDPVADGLAVYPETKIILVEGLYLLLRDEPWSSMHKYLDDKWFITVCPRNARMRVAKRHVAAGIATNLAMGLDRADMNDAINGQLISSQSVEPDIVVESIEEEQFGECNCKF
ncbi:hypothetical protein TRVA0_015S01244 [Trichomonascus vanleenenianus]|uniref:Yfh7p n=1 Tax=Trichomonascus vanleenenianus TaxID=2268995 RepID=UPI003ECAF1A7